jgi:putative hydrolase of the HAD superfamily
MMTVRAVGFDLGETLIHFQGIPLSWRDEYPAALTKAGAACGVVTGENHIAAAVPVLERYNTRITPRIEEVEASVVFAEVLATWELTDAGYCDIAAEAFFGHFRQEMAAYDDTLPVLSDLRRRGVPVGVLTDVPYGMPDELTREYLTLPGLEPYVGHLVTSVMVGVRKPDPEGYRQLAARLGVSVNEMVYIGNERKDIEGANRAGAVSVLLDREGRHPEWGQRYRIESLYELRILPELAAYW